MPLCTVPWPCWFFSCASQVQQTVTASYTSEAAAQDRNIANLYVTGPSCSPPPAEFLPAASSTTAPSSTSSSTSGPTPTTSTVSSGGTPTATSSSSGGGDSEPLPAGLSVVLTDVQQQRSSSPAWELGMEPADNVTFTAGKAASVGFKLTWSKTKPVSRTGWAAALGCVEWLALLL